MAAQPQAPPLRRAQAPPLGLRRAQAPCSRGSRGTADHATDEEMVSAQIMEGPKAIGQRILPTIHSPVVTP